MKNVLIYDFSIRFTTPFTFVPGWPVKLESTSSLTLYFFAISTEHPKFLDRDTKARDTYRKEIKKSKSYRDDIFVLDILREEMAGDDPRIQRILFE